MIKSFIFLLLFCLGYLLSNHYAPFLSFYNEFFIVAAFLFLLAGYCTSSVLFRADWLVYWCGVWLLLAIMQSAFGVVFYFQDVFLFCAGLLLFLVVYVFFSGLPAAELERVKQLFWLGCIVVGVLSAWVSLRQWLLLSSGGVFELEMAPGGRPYANLAQPNHVATLLCLSLVGVAFFIRRGALGLLASGTLSFLLLVALVLADSRTSWLFAAGVCVWLVFFAKSKRLLPWLAVVSSAYVLLYALLPLLAEALGVASPVRTHAASVGARLDLWSQALHAIAEGEVYGYGIMQGAVAQLVMQASYPVTLNIEYFHNILLDFLIWGGAIGAILALVFAVNIFRLYRADVDQFSAVGFVAIFAHAFVEFAHMYFYFLLPAAFFLATMRPRLEVGVVLGRPYVLLVVVFLSAAACYYFYEYKKVEQDREFVAYHLAGFARAFPEGYALQGSVLFDGYAEFSQAALRKPGQSVTDKGLAKLRRVAYRYPSTMTLSRYIDALKVRDMLAERCRHERVAQSLFLEGRANASMSMVTDECRQ